MTRWLIVIGALVVVLAVAGCGGDADTDNGNGGNPTGDVAGDPGTDGSAATATPTRAPAITATFRPPAPRSKELPGGEPVDFEAPFNAGGFLRETIAGNPVSAQTGGQRAVYTSTDGSVTLTVFFFMETDEATRNVEFTLANAGGELIGEPYYAPTVSFGMVHHTSGDTIAAWSHQGWTFIAQADTLELLQTFLDVFPY